MKNRDEKEKKTLWNAVVPQKFMYLCKCECDAQTINAKLLKKPFS